MPISTVVVPPNTKGSRPPDVADEMTQSLNFFGSSILGIKCHESSRSDLCIFCGVCSVDDETIFETLKLPWVEALEFRSSAQF
jgi:hypothetical protein